MAKAVLGGALRVGAILLLSLCSGCGLNLTMVATPDPVVVGSPLTYNLSVTNLASCPIDKIQLVLYPLADDDDPNVPPFCQVAAAQESAAELAPPGTIASLHIPSFSHQTVRLISAESSAGTITCTEPDGSSPITCGIGTLEPDARVRVTITLTATRPGTFADVAMVGGIASAQCQDQGAEAMDTICGETTVIAAPAAPVLSLGLLAGLAFTLFGIGLWRQRKG